MVLIGLDVGYNFVEHREAIRIDPEELQGDLWDTNLCPYHINLNHAIRVRLENRKLPAVGRKVLEKGWKSKKSKGSSNTGRATY